MVFLYQNVYESAKLYSLLHIKCLSLSFLFACWGEGHNLDVIEEGAYKFKTMSDKGGRGQNL